MENTDESQEAVRLRMRIGVLEENVKSCELECKASRGTAVRLVAELDRERRKASSGAEALSSVKMELDGLLEGRRSVELERETLVERLKASRRVAEAAGRESRCLEGQVEELGRRLQSSQGETRRAEQKLQSFLETVVGLLKGTSEEVIQPTEEEVLHKVDQMEAGLRRVSAELDQQVELRRGEETRAQLAERQVQDLRGRLQGLEAAMLAADKRHDGLQCSQQHYQDFLEQMSAMTKVDGIAVELAFDARPKLLLSRVEQLVQQEASALMASRAQASSLHRKLKLQKDQLESKGLHVQLLREKVSELEEEKRSRSAAERDDAGVEARRLQRKVERLQSELKAAKLGNAELKARLSQTGELKNAKATLRESQSLQEQKRRLDQLEERSKEEQQQLRTLRQSRDQLAETERELMDFRMVVSQMLGLDAAALAHPNYDIIKVLETLLHAHHHHHHHDYLPWRCPTHQWPHLHPIQDLPYGSCPGLCTSRSGPGDSAPLHEA